MAHISCRINPDVDARTHAKISTGKKADKFGIAFDRAVTCFVGENGSGKSTVLEAQAVPLRLGVLDARGASVDVWSAARPAVSPALLEGFGAHLFMLEPEAWHGCAQGPADGGGVLLACWTKGGLTVRRQRGARST